MNRPADLAYARFAREWAPFIDKWARKVARRGSAADLKDQRQAAEVAAWRAFVTWQELPEPDRTAETLKALIARKIKDAVLKEQRTLFDDRSKRVKATLMREYIAGVIKAESGYSEGRLETFSRTLTALHLLVYGLHAHGAGSATPETQLMRDEARQRLLFALDRLDQTDPRAYVLIHGHYFEHRELSAVGAELGIRSASSITRLHHKALDILRHEMEEFASLLATRNAGSLDDEPVLR